MEKLTWKSSNRIKTITDGDKTHLATNQATKKSLYESNCALD